MENFHYVWPALAAIVGLIGLIITISKTVNAGFEKESKERANTAAKILAGQGEMKNEWKAAVDEIRRKVEKIEDGAKDFRPGKSIDDAFKHTRGDYDQKFVALRHEHDKLSLKFDTINEKVIKVETKHDLTAQSVSELKSELKETRSEINDRFDNMAEQQKQQFDQLCASIREVRETKPR